MRQTQRSPDACLSSYSRGDRQLVELCLESAGFSEQALEMFASLGVVEVLPSNLMGIGGAISGCGPAFVDLMMEAYADAAVKYGIPRDTAYRLVSQTVLGAAALQ